MIERAVILGHGERLELATALGVQQSRLGRLGMPDEPPVIWAVSEPSGTAGLASLDQAITEHLRRALTLTGGRVDGPQGAARLLQVNPSTLRAKLRKYRIDPAAFRQRGVDRPEYSAA